MRVSLNLYLLHFFLLINVSTNTTFPSTTDDNWQTDEPSASELRGRRLIEETRPKDVGDSSISQEEIIRMAGITGAEHNCNRKGLTISRLPFQVPGLYKFKTILQDEEVKQNKPCHTLAPLLCINRVMVDRIGYPITSNGPEVSFAGGIIASTSFPVMGCQISNTVHANAICERDVGPGFILATAWEGVIDATFTDGRSGNETIGQEWFSSTTKVRVEGGFVALGHLKLSEFNDFWIQSSEGNNCWYEAKTNLEGLEHMP